MTHWIGTSWKMNKTLAEARAFADGRLAARIDPRFQPFGIPPFAVVRAVAAILSETRVKGGAQDMHWADEGARAGKISPRMLRDCSLDIVARGHSGRREHSGTTDATAGLVLP